MTTRFSTSIAGVFLVVVALASGCSKQSKVDRAIASGDKNLAAGLYDLAQSEYEIAMKLLPENPKAAGRLGILSQQQGRMVDSYLLLRHALSKSPDDLELQLKFGIVSRGLAKTAEARLAARKVLEAQPTNEEALVLLAESCATGRDNEEARNIVTSLRERNPDVAGFHIAFGILKIAQKDQLGAEVEFRKALEINPKSSVAHSYLGKLLLARGDSALAGESFKMAAELEPLRSIHRVNYVEHLIRAGAVDEAKKRLAELTTKAPDYIPGLTFAMGLAYREKRYEESAAIAEKILERDLSNHDAMSQRAAVKMAQGDVEGAIWALKVMEELYAHSALVKFRLANAYLRKGDSNSAVEYLNKAVQLSPDYDDAILLLAEINLNKGNSVGALNALKDLVKRQPRTPRPYVLLAQAHHAVGKSEDGLKILSGFSRAFPKTPEGPFLMARILLQLGKKEEARPALEQAVQAAADYWPALEMLVNDDLLENRTSAAKQRVVGLLEKFPKHPVPLLLDAKVALQEGDEKRAQAALVKAIELAPNEPSAYVFLAQVYLRSKQPQQAIETLAALAAKKNDASTFMQLGVLNGALGHHEAARAAYEKALVADPKFVPALNNLASILSNHLGQVDQAETIAEKARALAPLDAHVLDTLGWIFALKGRYEAALPLIRSSFEKLAAELSVQYHLGIVQYRLGQEEQAAQVLRQVVVSGIDSPMVKTAQEHLAVLAIDGAKAGADVQRDLEARVAKDPKDPVALIRLAAIAAREGANDRAVAHYEAVLKINPRSVAALSALVDLYAGPSSNPARALEIAKTLHGLVPNDGETAWRLGRIALRLGEAPWAATVLRSAATALRDQPDLQFDLAQAVYGIGRVEEAERALSEALGSGAFTKRREEAKRFASMVAATADPARAQAGLSEARQILAAEPDYLPALQVSALAQEQTRNFKGAAEIYQKILARHPLFVPAMRGLAIAYADHLGDDKKAEELALKVRQTNPEDPVIAYCLGTICFRRGDFAEAARHLKQSARMRDKHAETFFYLGMAEYQLKNISESRAQLQRALRLDLPPQEANEAKRLLEQMSR